MPGNNSPKSWSPSTTKFPLMILTAGEWAQVFVSHRDTNVNPVNFAAGNFMIHCIVTPFTDDTVHHYEQPTTFGGSPRAENRRRDYHIDPGVRFQVPWKSELSVVAGDNNGDPLDPIVDIIIARGYPPRMPIEQMAHHLAEQERERVFRQLCQEYDPELATALVDEHCEGLKAQYVSQNPSTPVLFPPPVVGTGELVPATWVNIAAGKVLNFPDGAQKIEIVNQTGVAGSPTQLTVAALGNNLRLDVASGIPRSIGPWTQGGQCSNGVPGTWAPTAVTVANATIWSSFGN